MQNVIGSGFSHTLSVTRLGRLFVIGLLVASTAAGVSATEAPQSPAPVQLELKSSPEPLLLANPLKRPKEKVPHITYHRKDYYYC
jgi:hypothetical protein